MTMPSCVLATYADEAALIDGIRTTAAATTWWTTWNTSTQPANSTWFRSNGIDGTSLIAGGLQVASGANRVQAAPAVDVNSYGFTIGGNTNVGGWTNNDSGGVPVANRVQAFTDNDTIAYAARDNATSYRALITVGPDSIACISAYTSGGLAAKGLIYIGNTQSHAGRFFQTQAKAKITSVGAGSNANQRLVTLDRNITSMLKDGTAFPNDPYTQTLMFQVGETPTAADDFALVQRISIVAGTLSTSGGATRFEINVAGVKLASATGRYANNRGAGDYVRLMSQPNVAIACGDSDLTLLFTALNNNVVHTAWDAFGGQAAALECFLYNDRAAAEASLDPPALGGWLVPYRTYVVVGENNTGLITQADTQGLKNVGALVNLMYAANDGRSNFSIVRYGRRTEDRWRVLGQGGLSHPNTPNPTFDGLWMVGPGW
jgi:hypothetical protein